MNSQKHHYLHVFACLCVCVCVCEQAKDSWDGGGVVKGGESICSIHSLRNRSRILPACVATCQNLSS